MRKPTRTTDGRIGIIASCTQLAFCMLLSMVGCVDWLGLDVPPVPGNPITCIKESGYDVVVNWGAASDRRTDANCLEYRLVSSPDAAWIDTIEEVASLSLPYTSGAYIEMDWQPDTLTATVTVILEGAPIWFSVLVRDADGNFALYAPVEYFG